jgi:hypothetical protein
MRFATLTAAAALLAALAAPAAVHAQALPIVGGVTSVTLTAAPTLTTLGVGFGTLGTASASPGSDGIPLVYFPVTGGSIDTASFAGSIEHDGSGLSLSSGGTTVNLTDFVIDTVALTLTGQVAVVDGPALGAVPIFNLGFSTNPVSPFTLSLTAAAAGAITTVFGLPDLTGVTLGTANTIPITTAVPEPATYAAMLAGLALVALTLARRRAGQGNDR